MPRAFDLLGFKCELRASCWRQGLSPSSITYAHALVSCLTRSYTCKSNAYHGIEVVETLLVTAVHDKACLVAEQLVDQDWEESPYHTDGLSCVCARGVVGRLSDFACD